MAKSRRIKALEFLEVLETRAENADISALAVQLSKIIMPDVKLTESQCCWIRDSLWSIEKGVNGKNSELTILATYINSCA